MSEADIWTTRCTRCPQALDDLNALAAASAVDPKGARFVSVCCDRLDGAREILEREAAPRWSAVRHYFMAQSDKERAKQLLGFTQVPFYVVFDELGAMTFAGGKLDLASLTPAISTKAPVLLSPTSAMSSLPNVQIQSERNDAVLEIDDLDF